MSKLCTPDQPNSSFEAYLVSVEETDNRSEGTPRFPLGENNDNMMHIPDEADQRSGVMSITIPG